jgi:LPXTG-motif cell wall-anchored protein
MDTLTPHSALMLLMLGALGVAGLILWLTKRRR